jgi:hypothetical protein
MLSRLCALCLVLLAGSPFTAPFATCDLSFISGYGAHQSAPVRGRSHTTAAQLTNTAISFARLSVRERARDGVRRLARSGQHRSSAVVVSVMRRQSRAFSLYINPPPAFTTHLRL